MQGQLDAEQLADRVNQRCFYFISAQSFPDCRSSVGWKVCQQLIQHRAAACSRTLLLQKRNPAYLQRY
jgi:hypothetical protein